MSPDDIFVWPDDSWCYRSEYSEVGDQWRGDDYQIIEPGCSAYAGIEAEGAHN